MKNYLVTIGGVIVITFLSLQTASGAEYWNSEVGQWQTDSQYRTYLEGQQRLINSMDIPYGGCSSIYCF